MSKTIHYETVIGLEIHAELSTKTKLYCGCATSFGSEPNMHTCPVCLAMPGALPVLNKTAVEYAIKAGLSMNCEITKKGYQDRKNYFYPDLPKAYQISQLDKPLCKNGYIDIKNGEEIKRIRITRIHLEEDAGKLLHNESETFVDLNRGGTPLIEIVTEPDLRNAGEAKEFLESVKNILEYAGICDCKMEEGSLRCDVNISVRPIGQQNLGIRTEMKNLNSFKAVIRAIEYESSRQINELEKGNEIIQQTRRWNDEKGISFSMRSKEDAHDYRYFSDPDLVQIVITDEMLENIKNTIPELPSQRKEKYIKNHGLTDYESGYITKDKAMADFFEECMKYDAPAKSISNWLLGDVTKKIKERDIGYSEIPFTPEQFSKLVSMVENGIISAATGKKVLDELFDNPQNPEKIIKDRGFSQINDENVLLKIIHSVLDANPQSVKDYKAGKEKAISFLIGQTMRIVKKQGNPQIINKLLKVELDKLPEGITKAYES